MLEKPRVTWYEIQKQYIYIALDNFFNHAIWNTCGCLVVKVYGCGWLWVNELMGDDPDYISLFGIDKELSRFCFGGGRHHKI